VFEKWFLAEVEWQDFLNEAWKYRVCWFNAFYVEKNEINTIIVLNKIIFNKKKCHILLHICQYDLIFLRKKK